MFDIALSMCPASLHFFKLAHRQPVPRWDHGRQSSNPSSSVYIIISQRSSRLEAEPSRYDD